jgi:hypothetical protein
MKLPILIINDNFLKSISIFMKTGGIALFPFIILNTRLSKVPAKINHETIHIKQQQELLVLFFYLWYVTEYIFRTFQYGISKEAYMNISFEREAYLNEGNANYLVDRKFYSFLKYIKK